MPRPPITTFSSVKVNPSPTNNNNGLYVPQLTTAQIAAIPPATLQNGIIVYDSNTNRLKTRLAGVEQQINTGVGVGDVVGPVIAGNNNIVIFDGLTGKAIKDSGVIIDRVPALLLENSFNSTIASNIDVNEIGNLGHIRFIDGTGFIFVDALSPVGFYLNDFGPDSQICSVFTGGIPEGTTTPSCLVELNSTTGALVLSRLNTEEIDALFATPGMILFNASSNRLNYHNGTDWLDSGGIELIGAVTGDGVGIIDTTLASTITCPDIQQTFTGGIPGIFGLDIDNSTNSTTFIEITAGGQRRFNLIYSPIGYSGGPLNSIDSPAIPFALGSFGAIQFFKDAVGNIGIGTSTPHAPLQFASTLANRKTVLYEVADNDHEFFGLGIDTGIFRYQTPATTADHIFYAGTSSTTSNEVARITGTGNIKAAADVIANGDIVAVGTIYGRRPSGYIYALSGSVTSLPAPNSWVKINAGVTVSVLLSKFSASSNRLQYIGNGTTIAIISLNCSLASIPDNVTLGISIFRNGVLVAGSPIYNWVINANYYSLSTTAFVSMNNGDYIEGYMTSTANNSVVSTNAFNLSVTAT